MGLDGQLDAIDAQITELQEQLESCRLSIALSRAAVWLGTLVLLAVFTLAGTYRTAPVIFGAITALIGGIVWSGASRSSRDEVHARIGAAETARSRLIDEVASRNGWHDLMPTVH